MVVTSSRRRPIRWLFGLVAMPIVLALALGSFVLTVRSTFGAPAERFLRSYTDIPIPKAPPMPETTFVYDRDGNLLTTLHAGVNRVEVPLSKISPHLRNAVIAVEDKDYYRHTGISLPAMIRAALVDIEQGAVVQGGSTITQQYVKLVYTSGERTISRKVKEAILAVKLSDTLTKDQILERYLNAVYFGNGAYGAEAAAQTYFGRPAAKLNVVQAALLAGLIRAPSSYDPYRHRKEARARRNLILGLMAQQGYLTPAKEHRLVDLRVRLRKPGVAPTPAAYFVDYVKRQLQDDYGVDQTFTGGLRVYTTIDRRLQEEAEQAVLSHLPDPKDPAAAMVAMDPRTGEILALVGGPDFTVAKYNLATQAHRQTGSAAKVFTFVQAMKDRMDPSAVMIGPSQLTVEDPRCLGPDGPWEVGNSADEEAGAFELSEALAHSVNTIFAQLVVDVGPKEVEQTAHAMGVRSKLEPVCSITLGSQSVTVMDMTTAYATLASRGIRHYPVAVEAVRESDGRILSRASTRGKRVLERNVADLTTWALQGVIDHGTGTAANIGRPAAGKTGTAQNYQDAWFCGYVPQLAACVWVGYPKTEDRPLDNIHGFAHVFGGTIPALIWHDFMSAAVQGLPVEGFAAPTFEGWDVQPERLVSLPPPPPPPEPPKEKGKCKRPPCHPPGDADPGDGDRAPDLGLTLIVPVVGLALARRRRR
jgi:penicillin-binding protein 1A